MTEAPLTINIVGAGRVGRTMLHLCAKVGLTVRDVASRTEAGAQETVTATDVGRATSIDAMRPADIWLITVPDTEIKQIARRLAQSAAQPAIAVHCSGFHPAEIMAPLREAGWQLASLHPVRSFADSVAAAADFPGTLCGVEGNADAVPFVRSFVETLGGVPFDIASDGKALYHGAAVFSNNFTTLLQAMAQQLWAEAGVAPEVAVRLQEGLLRNALDNVTALGPRDALTGPAARGDHELVAAQSAEITAYDAELGRLYDQLSAMAASLKTTGKV